MTDIIPDGSPWRLAVMDRGDDAKLMLATIALADDVTSVQLRAGDFYDWKRVLRFITERAGQPVELVPLTHPVAWTIRPATRRVAG